LVDEDLLQPEGVHRDLHGYRACWGIQDRQAELAREGFFATEHDAEGVKRIRLGRFHQVLRAFFRHHRRLYGEISKLVYRMIQRFCNAAAGRRAQSAALFAYASSGEFARWNPHLQHAIFLEG
jgi:hypothetical protein